METGSFDAIATVEAYDPVSDTWEQKSDLIIARLEPALIVYEGKLLALGGVDKAQRTTLNTVEVYDAESDTWTLCNSLYRSASFSTIDSLIYIFGVVTNQPPYYPTPANYIYKPLCF